MGETGKRYGLIIGKMTNPSADTFGDDHEVLRKVILTVVKVVREQASGTNLLCDTVLELQTFEGNAA